MRENLQLTVHVLLTATLMLVAAPRRLSALPSNTVRVTPVNKLLKASCKLCLVENVHFFHNLYFLRKDGYKKYSPDADEDTHVEKVLRIAPKREGVRAELAELNVLDTKYAVQTGVAVCFQRSPFYGNIFHHFVDDMVILYSILKRVGGLQQNHIYFLDKVSGKKVEAYRPMLESYKLLSPNPVVELSEVAKDPKLALFWKKAVFGRDLRGLHFTKSTAISSDYKHYELINPDESKINVLYTEFAAFVKSNMGLSNNVIDDDGKINVTFVSRAKAKRRKLANEKEIIEYLQSREDVRVQSIALEEHSLEEQISIMHNTNVLVGMHGAGLVNLIFMSRGSVVIEMFPFNFKRISFETLAAYTGMHYISWVNKCPLHTTVNTKYCHDLIKQHIDPTKATCSSDRFIERIYNVPTNQTFVPQLHNILQFYSQQKLARRPVPVMARDRHCFRDQNTIISLDEFKLLFNFAVESHNT